MTKVYVLRGWLELPDIAVYECHMLGVYTTEQLARDAWNRFFDARCYEAHDVVTVDLDGEPMLHMMGG